MDGIDDAVRALRAAGDPTRVRILLALTARSLCVCELVALVDVGQPAVSRHLGILQDAGLVESVRDGRWVDYRLADDSASTFGASLLAGLRQLAGSDPGTAAFLQRAQDVDRRQLAGALTDSRDRCRTPRSTGSRR